MTQETGKLKDITNFVKTASWNFVAGVESPKDLNHFPHLAYKLIKEEFEEYEKALVDYEIGIGSKSEVAKELTDLLYVVYGAFYRYGLDADVCFDTVNSSNFTKFCRTEDDAKASVEALKAEGKDAYYEKVGRFYVLKSKDTGKVLKGLGYVKADLTALDRE